MEVWGFFGRIGVVAVFEDMLLLILVRERQVNCRICMEIVRRRGACVCANFARTSPNFVFSVVVHGATQNLFLLDAMEKN